MKNILTSILLKIALCYYTQILRIIKDKKRINDYLYDYSLFLNDQTHDDHVYHFPQKIDIFIRYSIPIIKLLANKEQEKYISFKELTELLDYDLTQSKGELDCLRSLITQKQKHDSPFLIIMYHIPNDKWLLLDGRHRYIEYEKFSINEEHIPVLMVDSEQLMRAIINKDGFIAYCIQHNIYVFQEYPIWQWKEKLLNVHRFLW